MSQEEERERGAAGWDGRVPGNRRPGRVARSDLKPSFHWISSSSTDDFKPRFLFTDNRIESMFYVYRRLIRPAPAQRPGAGLMERM
ncbi:hypothetical protein EYF80_062626 [Liparis tanakae]|uniref:Uncharacterized protein n=1 Tax=Liparis tanakae TaxID=230148 RepID=A0A4Z2EES5_9TELE|nr:hypothetical protein EYF80_062626 [Liparis tanakae]